MAALRPKLSPLSLLGARTYTVVLHTAAAITTATTTQRRSDHAADGGRGAVGVATVCPSSVHAGRSFKLPHGAPPSHSATRGRRLGPPPRRAAAHAGPHVRRALLAVVEGAVAVDDLELVFRSGATIQRAELEPAARALFLLLWWSCGGGVVGRGGHFFTAMRARARFLWWSTGEQ